MAVFDHIGYDLWNTTHQDTGLRLNDSHLAAARHGTCSEFKADETTADDSDVFTLHKCIADFNGIPEIAQHEGTLCAGRCEPAWFGTGRNQKLVVRNFITIGEVNGFTVAINGCCGGTSDKGHTK